MTLNISSIKWNFLLRNLREQKQMQYFYVIVYLTQLTPK